MDIFDLSCGCGKLLLSHQFCLILEVGKVVGTLIMAFLGGAVTKLGEQFVEGRGGE